MAVAEIYSHSYENEYYLTRVYKRYDPRSRDYNDNDFVYSYHFKVPVNSILRQAKDLKMKTKNFREIADSLIELKSKNVLSKIAESLDSRLDRDCIRKIINLV